MRERKLILDGSPCDTNLHSDGPQTIEEAKQVGRSLCPHFDKCNTGFLGPDAHSCTLRYGQDVARYVLNNRTSIDKEMRDFLAGAEKSARGYIWSPDRKDFTVIKDFHEAAQKVHEFAEQLLGTENVGETFEDVVQHAMTPDGSIDLRKMDELEGRYGYNGGRGCDVKEGPCSCGAWH